MLTKKYLIGSSLLSLCLVASSGFAFTAKHQAKSKHENAHGSVMRVGQVEKVNLNQADLKQLMSIKGIGKKKAETIITYRKQNGNFTDIDQLKNLSGFSEKLVNKLKQHNAGRLIVN